MLETSRYFLKRAILPLEVSSFFIHESEKRSVLKNLLSALISNSRIVVGCSKLPCTRNLIKLLKMLRKKKLA